MNQIYGTFFLCYILLIKCHKIFISVEIGSYNECTVNVNISDGNFKVKCSNENMFHYKLNLFIPSLI